MSTPTTTALGHFVWHDHVSDDPDAAQAFYGELLGWEFETWKPGEMDYPMIKAGERHQGGLVKPSNPGKAPAHWAGYVQVEDAEATVARAEKAGATIFVPPTEIPGVGRFAAFGDPQGAILAIIEPNTEGPGRRDEQPASGAFCWDELMTTDLDAAKAFYGEVFGWELAAWDGGEMDYSFFQANGENTAGAMGRPEGVEAPSMWLSYVAVDDVDASSKQAEELGSAVHMGPMDIPGGMGRIAVLADPQGTPFGLFSRPAG